MSGISTPLFVLIHRRPVPCALSVRHISQMHPHKLFGCSWGVSPLPNKCNIVAPHVALVQMPAKESIPKNYSGISCFFIDLKYHSSYGTSIVCTSWSSSPNWTMKAGRLMKNNALPLNAIFFFFKIGRKRRVDLETEQRNTIISCPLTETLIFTKRTPTAFQIHY